MSSPGLLKLRAHDAEDLAVVSALLQDAIVPAKEMTFLADERRFVMVANRFMWERQPDSPLAPPAAPGAEEKARGEVELVGEAVGRTEHHVGRAGPVANRAAPSRRHRQPRS